MMKRLSLALKIVITAAVVLVLGLTAAHFYAKYLEIKEIGEAFTKVFFVNIAARVEMFLLFFVVAMALCIIDLSFLKGNAKRKGLSPAFLKRKFIALEAFIFAVIAALLFSEGLYEKFLVFRNAVSSGIKEPIFNLDISYFFFTREFLQSAAAVAMSLLGFFLVVNIVLYFLASAMEGGGNVRETIKDRGVFLHLAVNVIAICVLRGLMYYFDAQGILLRQDGTAAGALFTDVHVRLPFYSAAPYILLALSVAAAIFLAVKKYKAVVVTVLIFPALLLLMNVSAYLVNRLYVIPNEAALESEYIGRNMEYTKIGFNLDKVTVREFPAAESLSRESVEKNSDIVNNIRITDPTATLEVLNSTKSIRNYYTFNDADILEYDIGGKGTAVNIAARELDTSRLSGGADNYINKTFRYTHGYGIVMNPVNAVTPEGQPECVIQDMPIASAEGAPVVSEPRIYYGESTNDYCIVNTGMTEFDYALNDKNVETAYAGVKSGIKMTAFNRALFSLKNFDYMMLISGYIKPESRLLPNRNISERVFKAAPFMVQDPDPYIVLGDDGKLYWVMDLYTYSDSMPYGTRYNALSYIRNSAKAVVDAYEGTVDIYITDEGDSIIQTYDKIYPGVMKKGGLPDVIKDHIRYPEYLFKLQSEVYLRYHVSDTESFYTNSDLWMRAKEKYRGEDSISVEPYYNLLSVEDFSEEGAQLVLMQPFVPANKENLVAWMAADNYGNMISYRFPSGRTVYGTLHIENRIDSDAAISKELSLWNQGGSTVLRGNLLVIPIEDSIIYVEPVYITTSNDAAVPEVKRIIMAYGDSVVMRESLEECFDALFGEDAPAPGGEAQDEPLPETEYTPSGFAQSAVDAYDAARGAMRSGDWKSFGEAMDALGDAIDAMRGGNEIENP